MWGRGLWDIWVGFDWSAPPPAAAAAAACDCGTEKPVSILGLYSVSQPAPTSPPISAGSVLQLWGGALPLPVWVLARDTQSLYLSIILLHPLALGLLSYLEPLYPLLKVTRPLFWFDWCKNVYLSTAEQSLLYPLLFSIILDLLDQYLFQTNPSYVNALRQWHPESCTSSRPILRNFCTDYWHCSDDFIFFITNLLRLHHKACFCFVSKNAIVESLLVVK